ncbi:hypothetical protein [Streptomyces sp. NBC_00401]|uniref:hypothetical protein n=1 Tax=Streptomyces sp. NBC_00401 TaxID=2975738 RepID=UPI0022552BB2|nr:hypothetical protein [Streptomyces sp. NBC_00401]MCX5085682.1 hypothetical protein [Streptomyces sp. NBC_00401]
MRALLVRGSAAAVLALAAALSTVQVMAAADTSGATQPRVTISELPVPPTVPEDGVCTHPTGCVSADWSGIGTPGPARDPKYVFLGITYAGAPDSGPASVYSGNQILVVRTDSRTFPNGDAWKCITCGVSYGSDIDTSQLVYPPANELPDRKRVLVSNGILECGADGAKYAVTDPRCTPANTRITPIYWNDKPLFQKDAQGVNNGREWRLSPDGEHLLFNVVDFRVLSIAPYVGRIAYDQEKGRYHLTNVSVLRNPSSAFQPMVVEDGNRLRFNHAGMVGEPRGWTADGRATLGIQSLNADSMDAWATDLATGASRPVTRNAHYTDPMAMSPNGKWLLAEEVNGSGRLDFISGMPGIPPLTAQGGTAPYVSGIRNNGNRRFFSPWLVDPATGRGFQINAGSDPNWNAAADPVWLADSTAVVYTENLACGANPTPHRCADSTEPGGRNSRVMVARFPDFKPTAPATPAPVSDRTWGQPYDPSTPAQPSKPVPTGTYTLRGKVQGSATVQITNNSAGTQSLSVAVAYRNFSDDGTNIINGTEKVERVSNPALGCTPGTATALACLTWTEDLKLSGRHTGTKHTGHEGFTLGPAAMLRNEFQAVGTLTTIIDGTAYKQPANGS